MSYNTTQRVEWIDQCELWKRRMTDSKQIDFNVRLWRQQGWQSRWRPRPLYWAVHIHRGTFIGKTSLLPSSRWENFNISYVYFVEFEVLGVAHICLSKRWISNGRNQELPSTLIQQDLVVNVLNVLKLGSWKNAERTYLPTFQIGSGDLKLLNSMLSMLIPQ